MPAIIRNLIPTRWTSRAKSFLAAIFLSGAILLINTAQAMEIRQFDKMAVPDQSEYVGLLVQGAEKVLTDESRSDLAAQVEHLFTTTDPGDRHTIGMVEFESNLARAREADAKRVLSDPNAPRLEVEDAMLVTLKKNNIPLSQNFIRGFRAINSNFKPKFPPQQK